MSGTGDSSNQQNKLVNRNVETLYKSQRIDNIDPSNYDTYQQRYFKNSEFYQDGGPVLIFLDGNYIDGGAHTTEEGLWYEIAENLNGDMYYLEMRYFGDSVPTPNLSVENLRYLSTLQVIADTAHFIEGIKQERANSSVILIGSHYSAGIAVWARKRYPHLVDGVWASSVILNSVVNQIDFKEIVGAVFSVEGGPPCHDLLEDAFNEMEEMVVNGQSEELSDIFGLCEPIDLENEMDTSMLFEIVTEILGLSVQFAAPGEINNLCSLMGAPEFARPIYGVANFIKDILAEDGCFPLSYEYFVEFEREYQLDSENVLVGARQWGYLACVEFGWFHTSDSRFQPFGSRFSIDLFHRFCMDVFGERFTGDALQSNSDWFNIQLGGLNVQHITNVIYTQGMNDPWRTMGVQMTLNPQAEGHLIPGFAQSFDLTPIAPYDFPIMAFVKFRIQTVIEEWANISN